MTREVEGGRNGDPGWPLPPETSGFQRPAPGTFKNQLAGPCHMLPLEIAASVVARLLPRPITGGRSHEATSRVVAPLVLLQLPLYSLVFRW